MIGLAALSGLAGGIGGGLQDAQQQEMRRRLQEMQLQREALELGRARQDDPYAAAQATGAGLSALSQGPQGTWPAQPPGAPPMGGPQGGPGMPPQPQGPMGGPPAPPGGPVAAGFSDMYGPGGPQNNVAMYGPMADRAGTIAQARGVPNNAAMPPLTPPPPQQMPFTPQQQPVGGPQPQPMMPQGVDWRRAWQAVQQSGASPIAQVRAMDQIMKWMRPEEQAMLRYQMQFQLQQMRDETLRAIQEMKGGQQRDLETQRQSGREGLEGQRQEGRERLAGQKEEAASDLEAQRQAGRGALEEQREAGRSKLEGQRQENRKELIKLGGMGGRSAISQYMQRWAQEHPNATADEYKTAAQTFSTQSVAINRFLSGPQGNTIRSLNVVESHLSTLQDLGIALQNGDIPRFNEIAQRWAAETGSPVPTNFDTAKRIVGAEIVKALGVAGAGTAEERASYADAFTRAASPEQLRGAITTVHKLLGGQLRGLRKQFTTATGLPAEKFDEMLEPGVLGYMELRHQSSQAGSQSSGEGAAWTTMPDGTRIREIKRESQ